MTDVFGDRTDIPNTMPKGGHKGSKKARFDLLPGDVLWAWAEHMGLGAEKYSDRNWELGIRYSLNYQAAMRHLIAWFGGEDHDPELGSSHLTAALFNVACLLHFELNKEAYAEQDLDDRPEISTFKKYFKPTDNQLPKDTSSTKVEPKAPVVAPVPAPPTATITEKEVPVITPTTAKATDYYGSQPVQPPIDEDPFYPGTSMLENEQI